MGIYIIDNILECNECLIPEQTCPEENAKKCMNWIYHFEKATELNNISMIQYLPEIVKGLVRKLNELELKFLPEGQEPQDGFYILYIPLSFGEHKYVLGEIWHKKYYYDDRDQSKYLPVEDLIRDGVLFCPISLPKVRK